MSKWNQYTKEELSNIIQQSFSLAEVKRKLGYSENSGSANPAIKEMLDYYQFDTSHFKGQNWNKNNFDYSRFQKGKAIKSAEALKALEYKRGQKCECCGLSEWQGKPIPLELHHKNGDRLDNEESNLILLCPNCHALTDNYCGNNISKQKKEIPEEAFVALLKESISIRQALINLGLTPKGGNYSRARELIVKYDIKHLILPEDN